MEPQETVAFANATVTLLGETSQQSLQTSLRKAADFQDIAGVSVEVLAQDIIITSVQIPDEAVPVPGDYEVFAEVSLTVSGRMSLDWLRYIVNPIVESAEDTRANVYKMTQDQRRTVRNRSLFWFAFGALFDIVVYIGIFPYYTSWVWQNVIHYLRVSMIEKVEHVSLQFHNDSRAGDAICRVNQDSNQINVALQQAVIQPLMTVYGLIIAVAFVVAFDPLLAAGIVFVAVPMLLLTIYFTPRIRRRSVVNRVSNSNLTSRLQETFAVMKLVKANRAEDLVLARFNKDSHKALDAALYYRFEMIVLSMLVMLMGGALVISLEYLMVSWTVQDDPRPTYLGWLVVAWLGFKLWNLGAYNAANGRVGEVIGTV